MLLPGALLIQCDSGGLAHSTRRLTEILRGIVFLASRESIRLNRLSLRFDVDKPPAAEQKRLWQKALGPSAVHWNGTLDAVSQQFMLSARTIFSTGSLFNLDQGSDQSHDLWNACRSLGRPKLDDLAQRIVPAAGWDDLVLPDLQKQTLRQIASQVRQRMKVYETWGFSAKGRRGLGVSALFTGESGTGKTMAAEVLAGELNLDLYRIDLSAVVSKYIGETEKNLKQVFDAAEESGVLLLFDEADALFGKRSEVKDSHDRYANIEISYLLQRMETYQGLSILTTNLKSSMDRAFQRRLRFIVKFPFPDAAQREAIWSRTFPAETPTQGLDPKKLSQLNVAGGNIRNIALNAAFLAAEDGNGGRLEMRHLLQAARLESEKIERPISAAEIRGWM
jgi:ATPase family protein associated with various cellular activities (AAA)